MGQTQAFKVVGGYLRPAAWIHFSFNVGVAALLAVLGAPLFLLIALVLLLREGRPVFYAGERLGVDKKPFRMYKFRTLRADAQQMLGAELLGNNRHLITKTGKFLRDTRLDELPQLWNVLRRNMDLVGPRPVRPVIYEKYCRQIRGYDTRFQVRPGLIGFSQLFTPHSAPKTIRAYIDNRLLAKKERVLWDVFALAVTGLVMLRNLIVFTCRGFFNRFIPQRVLKRYSEKRMFDRVPVKRAFVYLKSAPADDPNGCLGTIVDINPEAFLMQSGRPLDDRFPTDVKLTVQVRKIGTRRQKTKTACCHARIFRSHRTPEGGWRYVIMYEALTPLSFYMIHQYFLKESVIHDA